MMSTPQNDSTTHPHLCNARVLLTDLTQLRERILHSAKQRMARWHPWIQRDSFQPYAYNLACYLALRSEDLREYQLKLAPLGISTLGNSESHVLPTLNAVIATLNHICGEASVGYPTSTDFFLGQQRLSHEAEALFGSPPSGHETRIMVTLPSEAADDYAMEHHLVAKGVSVLRINCAHDTAAAWEKMATHVRRAASELGQPSRVMMDLGGPKCRTGAVVRKPKHGRLMVGDTIHLSKHGAEPILSAECTVECAVPEIIDQLLEHAEVWIDDGKLASGIYFLTVDPATG